MATIDTLRATIPTGNGQVIRIAGDLALSDGTGACYTYNSSSTTTDDSYYYVTPTSPGTGRWIRQFEITTFSAVDVNSITSVAGLRSSSFHLQAPLCIVMGYYSTNDGGGGRFIWDSTNNNADDGGIHIKPNSISGAGRWIRVIDSDFLSAKWWGAKGDDVTDDFAAIQAALNYAAIEPTDGRWGRRVFFPAGKYLCSQPLNIRSTLGIAIEGENRSVVGGNNMGASCIVYTGTGSATPDRITFPTVPRPDSRFIDARSTIGLTIKNITIGYNNSGFEGNLIDLSHSPDGIDQEADSAYFLAEGCNFTGFGVRSAYCHISLWLAIFCKIKDCYFGYAGSGIRGNEGSGYSNAHYVENCNFDNLNNNTAYLDCSALGSGNVSTVFMSKALGVGINQWATLALNSWGGNDDSHVQAKSMGDGGNLLHVTMINDSVSGVTISETWPNITIHFQDGVSTVGDVETAITNNSNLIQIGNGNYGGNGHGTLGNILSSSSNGSGFLANGHTDTGALGNFTTVQFVGDSGSGVVINEVTPDNFTRNVVIHYQSGVSTVLDVENAVRTTSQLIEIKSAGTPHTLTSPADDFAKTYLTHGRTGAGIVSAGQGWFIKGCGFEGTVGSFNRMLRGYYCDSQTETSGLNFTGNWFGDAGFGVWVEPGASGVNGLTFTGNYCAGRFKTFSKDNGLQTGSTGIFVSGNWMDYVEFPSTADNIGISGVMVSGNNFDVPLTNVDAQGAHNISIIGNAEQGYFAGTTQLSLTGHLSTDCELDTSPNVLLQSAAGVGATVALSTGSGVNLRANDISGKISLTTGTGCTSGILFKFAFIRGYNAPPQIFLRPTNAAALAFHQNHYENGISIGGLIYDGFSMTAVTAPPDLTLMTFDYFIIA